MKTFYSAILLFTLYPLIIIAQDSVTIEGKIRNFEKYHETNVIQIIINDIVIDDQAMFASKISNDGTFKIIFLKDQPQDIYLKYRNLNTLFVSPGDHLKIEFDADDEKTSMIFSGDEAKTNENIKNYTAQKYKYWESLYGSNNRFNAMQKAIADSNAAGFKTYIYNGLKKETEFYESYVQNNIVTDTFKSWAKVELEYECADNLMRYAWLKPRSVPYKLPTDYYDFFDRFPLNNPQATISSKYGDYLHEFSNYKSKGQKFSAPLSFPLVAKIILDNAEDLTEKQKKKLAKIALKDSSATGIRMLSDFLTMKKIFSRYEDLISDKLSARALQPFISFYIKEFDGFLRDFLLSNAFNGMIEAKYLEGLEPYLEEYKVSVKTEYFKTKILARYNEEAKKLHNYELPVDATIQSTPSEGNTFNQIIEKYKGKVVYIDFWATWCGPCRAAMPASQTLRSDLKEKDVVFLYLGVESPENTWKSVIAELKINGEHFLLKDNDYKTLSAKFQITGIPHYVLIDKKGRIKDDNAKEPGNKALKKEIEKLLADN